MKIICENCEKPFEKSAYEIKRTKHAFCSKLCWSTFFNGEEPRAVNCAWCNKIFRKQVNVIKRSKSGNNFCSLSCSASYNNTQKRKSRRSKCEILLLSLLQKTFPLLEIIANDKKLLNGWEVDIAIPSINLAIEWNGIVHYKPIYGQNKLDKVQSNDREKIAIAQKNEVEFIVISDLVSTESYVKEAALKISEIIRTKL